MMMQEPTENHPTLSPDDRRVLDLLVDNGFEREAIASLPSEDLERADRILDLLGQLDAPPREAASDSLINATIARIDQDERQRLERLQVSTASEFDRAPGMRRIRMPDFITVAAVLLIVASVVLPVMSGVRRHSLDASCANNLRVMGTAFSTYATDYDGAMPQVSTAGFASSWDRVSNFRHVSPLVAGQYCPQGCTNCPGHDANTGPGYAYQWQPPNRVLRLQRGRTTMILMGDRNPLIDAIRLGQIASPTSVSLNHGGRGQNVLWSDGSTAWLSDPVVHRDDIIWLPRGAAQLRQDEVPTDIDDAKDVFLAQ